VATRTAGHERRNVAAAAAVVPALRGARAAAAGACQELVGGWWLVGRTHSRVSHVAARVAAAGRGAARAREGDAATHGGTRAVRFQPVPPPPPPHAAPVAQRRKVKRKSTDGF
jgi:hypothetical protein